MNYPFTLLRQSQQCVIIVIVKVLQGDYIWLEADLNNQNYI